MSKGNSIDILAEARKVLDIEARAIGAMASRLGEGFVRAAEMMHSCQGRVIVTGMGKSGLVGQKIASTLSSTGTPAFFLHPAEATHGDLGMVKRSDVFLALSNSGETREVLSLIPFIKRFEIGLVAMTGGMGSTLARAADAVLDTYVAEEACPMGLAPTASTTAAMAMGDALAVVLLVKKGFSREDFAVFHPGGALGKKLLVRVRDLMHGGAAVPRVGGGTMIPDALLEISSKRLGLTLVVDDGGAMVGVLTDGDLRRGLERWGAEEFFRKTASEGMTANPKTISPDALATEALAIMQRHSITALVVSGGPGGEPEGVLHIHDILKEGIV